MTINELGALVGMGIAAGGVVANASIAWWRIGQLEKKDLAHEKRFESLELWKASIEQARAVYENERPEILRRVGLIGEGAT